MKNKILKMINRIVLVLMIICICSVDIIPMVGIMVCAAWLTIYYYLHEDELLDVLDKIRAEIEQEYKAESEHPYGQGLRRALQIIDKHKAETEREE